MNSVLAITLARGGSKGVLGKHVRMLGGKPLLAWTIEQVNRTAYARNYVVSSDDKAILNIARRMKVHTIVRPKELAQDNTPTMPALQHAVQVMEDMYDKKFDIIAEIRATSPFKTSEDIDGAIALLIQSGADSVIGVTPLEDHHPARIKWLDERGFIHDFVPEPQSGRRQDLQPKAYVRNGTFYVLWREWVMGPTPRLFGHEHSLGLVMPPERSINIDTEMDWMLCEAMIDPTSSPSY